MIEIVKDFKHFIIPKSILYIDLNGILNIFIAEHTVHVYCS